MLNATGTPLETLHTARGLTEEQIEAQIDRGRWRLGFDDPGVEAAFQCFHLAESRSALCIALILGLLLYAVTGIIDYAVAGPLTNTLLALRLGIGVPALLLAFYVVLRADSDLQVQWAGFAGLTAAAWVVVAMLVLLPPGQQQFYLIGLTIMVLAPYCFVRLRARFALLTGCAMLLGYAVAIPVFRQPTVMDWVLACYFLLVGNIVGFVACYLIEFYMRRSFLSSALLDLQRGTLEATNRRLRELSITDPLTGTVNRRHLEQCLDAAWRQAERDRTPIAVVMFDLDGFKQINDLCGHQLGDECLIAVAEVARAWVRRPLDAVARYGGEEFVIVLSGASRDDARNIAEQIRMEIKTLPIREQCSPEAPLTVSAGVASTVPDSKCSPEILITLADRALYTAKRQGRDRVAVAGPDGVARSSAGG